MSPELWRLWALIDLSVLCASGVVFYMRWRPATRLQAIATAPYAALVLIVGCAIAVNFIGRVNLTPGLQIVAICSTPLALLAGWVTVQLWRGHD